MGTNDLSLAELQPNGVGGLQHSMIPIKIQCGCGEKYAFEVEPIGQSMVWAVQCPVCGADGTTAANQTIAQYLSPPVPPDLRLRIGAQTYPHANVIPFAGNGRDSAS